ncbi:MAG: hypothetical protein J6B85_13740 [Lachnospiraceae bacterium]|nr:hypothetical protein [Lachnospiraceae bacterium]
MNKEELIQLKVISEERARSIFLDDKKLNHVENYKIEQASLPGTAKLTLEILVKYP